MRFGLCVERRMARHLNSSAFADTMLDLYDRYIIVSFVNATLVLSIGESVEEVTDSGFLGTVPTIATHLIGDDSIVQVPLVFSHGLLRQV